MLVRTKERIKKRKYEALTDLHLPEEVTYVSPISTMNPNCWTTREEIGKCPLCPVPSRNQLMIGHTMSNIFINGAHDQKYLETVTG